MIKDIKDKPESRFIEIDLTGPEGNAFQLMAYAKQWAEQTGFANVPALLAEMQEGDYDHLVATMEKYFGDYVIFYR